MYEFSLTKDLDVTAEKAYALLSDWGDTSWLKGPERTEVVRDDDRVTRRLHMAGSDPVEETLLSADPQTMTLHYTIAPCQLFKLENYQGTIVVKPAANGCSVDWHCRFDEAGMQPEEARSIAEGNLNFLLDSLAGYLES